MCVMFLGNLVRTPKSAIFDLLLLVPFLRSFANIIMFVGFISQFAMTLSEDSLGLFHILAL